MTTAAAPTAATPHSTLDDPAATLAPARLDELRAAFEDSPAYRIARNAVARTTVIDVALDRDVVTSVGHTFSHKLDDWAVTNQEKSGRCWMFAALNLFRVGAMRRMNLKEFEFSQNWTLFWDKLERANYFLESIIETADRELDDRTVEFLLQRPLDDGGQWNMFINIVRKYGLVPKAVMPETESSSNTARMNANVVHRLRAGARQLRELRAAGAPMEAARAAKDEVVAAVHRMLCIHLGTPPRDFDWQWNDKDGAFHREGAMTPLAFAEKFVDLPLDEYVCLVHDPRNEFDRTYTVEYLGNVVGGAIVKYLNVEIDTLKTAAQQAIVGGEPVWFGCDVGQMMHRTLGIWDARLFDYGTLYDTTFELNKAERLRYHHSLMTHAMLFTGVDVVDGGTRRWRVENSWGDDHAQKGFYAMNDAWFDEYVFEIAARRSSLPEPLQSALDADPVVLPAWDPMGALA